MDLTKKTVHYTQEGKTVFDRFYLDEDYNVPEQKEAVQRIVYSSAKLKTSSCGKLCESNRKSVLQNPLYDAGGDNAFGVGRKDSV